MLVVALFQTCACHHSKRHCQVLKNSINDGEFISNNSNELTMIAHTLSAVGKRTCIRPCVKKRLFRLLKFFNRNKHGMYDLRSNSVTCLQCKITKCHTKLVGRYPHLNCLHTYRSSQQCDLNNVNPFSMYKWQCVCYIFICK